jgi:hypothetical protein
MRTATVFAFLLFLISACDQVDETPIETPGPEYFPLETGRYIVYNVDSTNILLNAASTHTFQLRLSVGTSFANGEGNTTYVIQRHKRADATSPWMPAGTWTAWKSIRQAVVSEGTTSYVKLQFPLSVGTGWDGNALNTKGGDENCGDNTMQCDRYEVTETDPDVLVIQNNDPDVLIRKDIRVEKYRKDVGLVYKEIEVLEYCNDDCFGTGFVNRGIRYKQEMIGSGTF